MPQKQTERQRSKSKNRQPVQRDIRRFSPHLKKIKKCFAKAISEERRRSATLCVVYGVYLKRRSNFAMLCKNEQVQLSELLYAIRESRTRLSARCGRVVIFEGDAQPLSGRLLSVRIFRGLHRERLPIFRVSCTAVG